MDWEPRWEAYWTALCEGDSTSAVSVAVGLNDGGMAVIDILEDLVGAGQREVGRLWAVNDWNVAQEHRATSVSEEVVAALAGRIPGTGGRGTAVVTCIDGEWHSLPSRVVATALRSSGWRVHYLGASVPVEHLAQFLQDVGPDVAALSCSLPTRLGRARAMIEASRQAGVPVVVGGPGFGPDGRWGMRLGADGTAPSARAAVELLSSPRWPRFTEPARPYRAPDDTSDRIGERRAELVKASGARLAAAWPGVREYGAYQAARTEEDLGHLLDFLAAALFVDDPELYTRFVEWMAVIPDARGVPVPALMAGLHTTGAALGEVLGDVPRAQQMVVLAREAIAGVT